MDDDMVLTTVALKLKMKKNQWDCLRFKVLETLAPSTAT